MRLFLFLLAFVPVYGYSIQAGLGGYRDCVRADDGRPVCINTATGTYHFVTEKFYRSYLSHSPDRARPEEQQVNISSKQSTADVYEWASRSVVMIVTAADSENQGLGSGVVVKPQSVVTNCHVLEGADAAAVSYQDDIYTDVVVIEAALDRDLCLVWVRGLPAPSIQIGTTDNVRVGQRVLAIGSPLGLELTLSEGLISSLRKDPTDRYPLIQTSAAISGGSSGGALLTEDGVLIGITTMQSVEGQNLNFAVPADWIRDFAAIP